MDVFSLQAGELVIPYLIMRDHKRQNLSREIHLTVNLHTLLLGRQNKFDVRMPF